jgi:hypothetical protein
VTDAGTVHFDADKALLRRSLGHLHEALAVAEADFEDEFARIAKEACRVHAQVFIHVQPVARPVFGQRPFLAAGDASLPQDEAADGHTRLSQVICA